MSLTDPLHVLDTRRSVPSKQLGEPGPDHATLLRMLASAVRERINHHLILQLDAAMADAT